MRNGTLKKWTLISVILFFTLSTGLTKEKLIMFTSVYKCKACNNPVLDLIFYNSQLLDSLNLEYELVLETRRSRDVEDYCHYYKLGKRLKIIALNDSIDSLYDPTNKDNYFLITRNDTVIFTTERLESLIAFLTK